MAEHMVWVDKGPHGSSETTRYRGVCKCGWIGGICDHYKTAEADGTDHLHEQVTQ